MATNAKLAVAVRVQVLCRVLVVAVQGPRVVASLSKVDVRVRRLLEAGLAVAAHEAVDRHANQEETYDDGKNDDCRQAVL